MNLKVSEKKLLKKRESLLSTLHLAKETKKKELNRLRKSKEWLQTTIDAQKVIQTVAAEVQSRVHRKIAELVTRCIMTVFPNDPYELDIRFEKKRGKTEAKMVFVRDGMDYDPIDGVGGGVLDVAAFALRLSCILLRKPRPRKLLVLDEPFKNINGADGQQRAAELVMVLAKEFKVQFIIVTDDEWLKIGKVIDLEEL